MITEKKKSKNSKNSVMMRIPRELKERIERLSEELNASYEAGRITRDVKLCETLPTREAKIPQHEIIRLALDELEDHKARSRKR